MGPPKETDPPLSICAYVQKSHQYQAPSRVLGLYGGIFAQRLCEGSAVHGEAAMFTGTQRGFNCAQLQNRRLDQPDTQLQVQVTAKKKKQVLVLSPLGSVRNSSRLIRPTLTAG